MNSENILQEISKLTIAQKILLLEQAWDTIQESGQKFAIPDWQRDELDRRLAEHHVDPDANITTAANFHAELRKS